MFLQTLLLLLVCACVDAMTSVDCNETQIYDPCSCTIERTILTIDDNAVVGTSVAEFNISTEAVLDSTCSYFNLTSGQLILLKDLRNPCAEGQTCSLNCGANMHKTFIVIINNIDENLPEFPNTTFVTHIYENASVSTVVFKFDKDENRPVDKDCPPRKSLSYCFNYQDTSQCKQESEDGIFEIYASNGEISLKKELDYEKSSDRVLNLTVSVISIDSSGTPGNPGFTNLIVRVLDVDDNDPQFEHLEYDLEILEETISSTPISGDPVIRAFDQDRGINQTILYSFEDSNVTSDFLLISQADATFTVIGIVDREDQPSYTMTIWCFQSDDHERKASAKLNIHVLDINDNLPIFDPVTYNVTLVENAIGYVTTVTATDLDVGENAEIFYELAGPGPLEVDQNSGVISVKTSSDLDREDSPVITVLVRAKDKDGNYSTGTATVYLTLDDINDNSPTFTKDYFVFHINSTNDGDDVGKVEATDEDDPVTQNANVTYEIHSASTANVPFIIDPLTGQLTIKGVFDRDVDYGLLVMACDNPDVENDRRCSLANVAVLYGKNISYTTDDIELSILENMPVGTVFGDVLPIHGDTYVCSTDEFTVDELSSMLKTNVELDRESNDTYIFIIDIFQYNKPKGNISVTLSVEDDNDNAPVFTQEEYFLSINENIEKNQPIGTLNATDDDINDNANLTFSFQQQFELFTVDGVTGEVMKSDKWNENTVTKNSLYRLIAVVEDQGEPALRSVVPVYVSSMEVRSDLSVGIPTPLSKDTIMKADTRVALEQRLAEILDMDTIKITDVNDATSLVYIKAAINGSDVMPVDLQRSLANYWSPVQDLFRQYMVPLSAALHSDTGLSTAEIALIAIAVTIFFGAVVAIIIICKQWDTHIKSTRLYDTLRRPSKMYDSQELRMDFGDELPSRFSTFKGPGKRNEEIQLEGSFGLGFVNAAFSADGEELNTPRTPTWSCSDTPRIPRWSTSDSLKDAMASLEELTSRLNNEDSISRVSNMSRSRRSVKSNKSDLQTPRSDTDQATQSKDGRKVPGYEDLDINTSTVKDYEDLHMGDGTGNVQHNNQEHFGNEKTASERIQDIIENNRNTDDYENMKIAKQSVNGDVTHDIQEECTAF